MSENETSKNATSFVNRFPFWGTRGDRQSYNRESLTEQLEFAESLLDSELFMKWILELEEEYLNPLYNTRVKVQDVEESVITHLRVLNDILQKIKSKAAVSKLAIHNMEEVS